MFHVMRSSGVTSCGTLGHCWVFGVIRCYQRLMLDAGQNNDLDSQIGLTIAANVQMRLKQFYSSSVEV